VGGGHGHGRGMDYEGTTATGMRAVRAEWLTHSDGGIEQRGKTSCEHSSAEQNQGQTHSPLKCTVYDQLRRASGMLCNKTMAASLVFPCLDPSKFAIPSMHKLSASSELHYSSLTIEEEFRLGEEESSLQEARRRPSH
jgi:hypothetical protein